MFVAHCILKVRCLRPVSCKKRSWWSSVGEVTSLMGKSGPMILRRQYINQKACQYPIIYFRYGDQWSSLHGAETGTLRNYKFGTGETLVGAKISWRSKTQINSIQVECHKSRAVKCFLTVHFQEHFHVYYNQYKFFENWLKMHKLDVVKGFTLTSKYQNLALHNPIKLHFVNEVKCRFTS